jgi:HSP20 family protein
MGGVVDMFDLVRWSPFGSFGTPFRLHREIDELFGRFFGQNQSTGQPAAGAAWWPAVESWVSDGNLHIRVALPGVDPKDVELSLSDNVLTLKGERKAHGESPDGSYYRREFSFGAFERSLALPEGVDPAKVTAKYSNGMLEITVPAPLSVAPKKVDIQIEGQPAGQKSIKA